MRGRSAATPAHPYLKGGHIPRHYTRGPTPLPPARGGPPPRHTATPCRAPGGGTIPLPEAPPPHPIRRIPPDEPTHAKPGSKRAIALLTLKAEATIPRDLQGENHLMVEGPIEHVLNAAMYATASASRLCRDRPSPPLAQAAQDAPDTGPTAEDIHQILTMRAPPKTNPEVCPIQARQLGRHERPPGHHGGPHPQTPGHLVGSGMGRPRQGQTGNSTRPRR